MKVCVKYGLIFVVCDNCSFLFPCCILHMQKMTEYRFAFTIYARRCLFINTVYMYKIFILAGFIAIIPIVLVILLVGTFCFIISKIYLS